MTGAWPNDARFRGDRCIRCTMDRKAERARRREHTDRVTHCVVCGEPFFDVFTLAYLERQRQKWRRRRLLPDTLQGIRGGRVDREGRALRSDKRTCSARCRKRLERAARAAIYARTGRG